MLHDPLHSNFMQHTVLQTKFYNFYASVAPQSLLKKLKSIKNNKIKYGTLYAYKACFLPFRQYRVLRN